MGTLPEVNPLSGIEAVEREIIHACEVTVRSHADTYPPEQRKTPLDWVIVRTEAEDFAARLKAEREKLTPVINKGASMLGYVATFFDEIESDGLNVCCREMAAELRALTDSQAQSKKEET